MTTSQTDICPLNTLEFVSYLSDNGLVPDQFQGKVGVYAIFDAYQILQYIGYSRDIYLSLKQHLVRQPQSCHWLKVQTIDRPSRTVLEGIRDAWITENNSLPTGNGDAADGWNQPIDVKGMMTAEEQASFANAINESAQVKVLKQVARRVESSVLELLKTRGVQEDIRFNPKLKESGLLDLK
ncbi:GIY-YIG nuclease family protein [Phormidium sp. CLA17]|uniref:GIY-YIG nuclease family protein n=1 Tax=Leptolyngbya sp. Cla-17 TaxID=2803751 RepID=UPI0014932691|nr:GIY-YIG nuclease family protein [Leptolyngbya sp. Cla-17]MBM0740914.1 GIY-YIG nuclease family protein [Leptolyngbya sp. Cla-17]